MNTATPIVALTLTTLATAGPPPVIFTDVTDTAGVSVLGTLTESVAWGDYDNDGDQDLYLTGDGVNRLFRNDGSDVFTDVTDVTGTGNPLFSVGTLFADLDNDGDLDLYVVNFLAGPDVLYRNNGQVGPDGEYTFTDVTASAGTTVERSSRGVAVLDYDHDGLLDIYVNAIGDDLMYHNLGDLQFEEIAGVLGVNSEGQGVGVVATDVDRNGWVDLYTGNRSGNLNRLYMNHGGVFTDVTLSAGLSEVGLGMGVLSIDHDNDLDFDLYWTTWPGPGKEPVLNQLYRNDHDTFANVSVVTGTDDPLGWGISCNIGDIDNDGWMDFFVTNGFDADTTPNVLFRNTGGGFEDVTAAIGGGDFDGRGVAFADYDNDGDLDLCVTASLNHPSRLWRNDTNNGHHWIQLRLEGRTSNRSAVGTFVEITAGGMTTIHEVSSGAGRGSFNSLPVEVGLGSATSIDSVYLRWPSGIQQIIASPPIDTIFDILEPVAGDVTGDGVVNINDLLAMLAAWGECPPPCVEDVNGNGEVDALDLLTLLANWG